MQTAQERTNAEDIWCRQQGSNPRPPDYKSGGEIAKLAGNLGFSASWFTQWGDIDDRYAGVSRIHCKPIDCHVNGLGRAVGGGA